MTARSERRVLLVTNDFPPTFGGIQSYLRDYCLELERREPGRLVVLASTQDAEAAAAYDATLPFPVIRWPHRILFPFPAEARRMAQVIRERPSPCWRLRHAAQAHDVSSRPPTAMRSAGPWFRADAPSSAGSVVPSTA